MNQRLADAEVALHQLEKHRHNAARSHSAARRAERLMHEFGDNPQEAAKYKAQMEKHHADHAEHMKAHAESGVTDRHIDMAAQAVLDARGEKHTDQKFVGGAEHEPSAPATTTEA